MQSFKGRKVEITFDPEVCIHSGECVRGLPRVFSLERDPWINPDAADEAAIRAQVAKCPSGALSVPEVQPAVKPEDDRQG